MAQANTGSTGGTGTISRTGAQNATGTPDATYNLISILYHALQGAETYEQYIRDAQQSGNNDLAQFFREVQQEDARRAQRGRELLAREGINILMISTSEIKISVVVEAKYAELAVRVLHDGFELGKPAA